MDVWTLFQNTQGIEELKQYIQFIVLEKEKHPAKLVLNSIETTEGKGIFILRKNVDHKCIFYNGSTSSCQIHNLRPQACRNFPFAFAEREGEMTITLVKDASSFCLGIGKGKDYSKEEIQKVGRHTIDTIKKYNNVVAELNKEALQNKPLTPHDALATLLLVAQKEQAELHKEFEIL